MCGGFDWFIFVYEVLKELTSMVVQLYLLKYL